MLAIIRALSLAVLGTGKSRSSCSFRPQSAVLADSVPLESHHQDKYEALGSILVGQDVNTGSGARLEPSGPP